MDNIVDSQIFFFCFFPYKQISPGIVETDFRERMYPSDDPEKAQKLYKTMQVSWKQAYSFPKEAAKMDVAYPSRVFAVKALVVCES